MKSEAVTPSQRTNTNPQFLALDILDNIALTISFFLEIRRG